MGGPNDEGHGTLAGRFILGGLLIQEQEPNGEMVIFRWLVCLAVSFAPH